MLVATSDPEERSRLEEALKEKFTNITVKTGNKVSFLGLEIEQDGACIKLSQRNYIKNMLDEAKVTAKALTPGDHNVWKPSDAPAVDAHEYASVLMKLMYVSKRTRPDILPMVTALATYNKNPNQDHWKRLHRVLAYLRYKEDLSLTYHMGLPYDPQMSTDASFNLTVDAKGFNGTVIHGNLKNAAVHISMNKQTVTADSSTESELMALAESCKVLMHVLGMYEELGYHKDRRGRDGGTVRSPIPVQQDNEAARLLISTDSYGFKGRSKYFNRKYFLSRDHVESGMITLVQTKTGNMRADFLTKVLSGKGFIEGYERLIGCK